MKNNNNSPYLAHESEEKEAQLRFGESTKAYTKPLIFPQSCYSLNHSVVLGEIYLGSKYWLSLLFHESNGLKAKAHFPIGSTIYSIDIKPSKNYIIVALGTGDGFVHLLKIEEEEAKLLDHKKALVFTNSATKHIAVIDEEIVVAASSHADVSIISLQDQLPSKYCSTTMSHQITVLKHLGDEIHIGKKNGVVDILNSKLEITKSIDCGSEILDIFLYPFYIINTKNSMYIDRSHDCFAASADNSKNDSITIENNEEEEDNLKTKPEIVHFEKNAIKAITSYLTSDGGIIEPRTFVEMENGDHFIRYRNGKMMPILLPDRITDATFLGDVLVVLVGGSLITYNIYDEFEDE